MPATYVPHSGAPRMTATRLPTRRSARGSRSAWTARSPGSPSTGSRPGRITFVHTEIDDAYAGQGLGGKLARAALDDVRARGLAVRPDCPFIKGWIAKHPDYADLVA